MAGRPTTYSDRYAQSVLLGLKRGLSVRKICAEGRADDPTFPTWRTVFDWLASHEQFSQDYARARVVGCEALSDELFAISDDNSEDRIEVVSEKTGELVTVTDHEHINRSRLRVDTRKWYLSKIVPKIYGDRLEVDHKGQVDLVSRLSEGRQRAALDMVEREINDGLLVSYSAGRKAGVLIEGSAERIEDGSDLV